MAVAKRKWHSLAWGEEREGAWWLSLWRPAALRAEQLQVGTGLPWSQTDQAFLGCCLGLISLGLCGGRQTPLQSDTVKAAHKGRDNTRRPLSYMSSGRRCQENRHGTFQPGCSTCQTVHRTQIHFQRDRECVWQWEFRWAQHVYVGYVIVLLSPNQCYFPCVYCKYVYIMYV